MKSLLALFLRKRRELIAAEQHTASGLVVAIIGWLLYIIVPTVFPIFTTTIDVLLAMVIAFCAMTASYQGLQSVFLVALLTGVTMFCLLATGTISIEMSLACAILLLLFVLSAGIAEKTHRSKPRVLCDILVALMLPPVHIALRIVDLVLLRRFPSPLPATEATPTPAPVVVLAQKTT